jgi:hypothetical protein
MHRRDDVKIRRIVDGLIRQPTSSRDQMGSDRVGTEEKIRQSATGGKVDMDSSIVTEQGQASPAMHPAGRTGDENDLAANNE